MRTFAESAKSQKSVASMIENKKEEPTKKANKKGKFSTFKKLIN